MSRELSQHSAVTARANVNAALSRRLVRELDAATDRSHVIGNHRVWVTGGREITLTLRLEERALSTPLITTLLNPALRDEVKTQVLRDLLTGVRRRVAVANVDRVPRLIGLTDLHELTRTVGVPDGELARVLVRRE